MTPFVKTAAIFGIAGALALSAATPSLARGRHFGPAVGAGFVAGAFLGAAAANANAAYYNGPYVYDAPAYNTGPAYGDAYGTAPGYDNNYAYSAPRFYRNNGPNREGQLTGPGAGFID